MPSNVVIGCLQLSSRSVFQREMQVQSLHLSSFVPGMEVFMTLLFKFLGQVPGGKPVAWCLPRGGKPTWKYDGLRKQAYPTDGSQTNSPNQSLEARNLVT